MFTCAGPSCLSSAPPAAADAAATERPRWRNRSPSSQSRVNGNAAPTPPRLRPSVHPSVRPRLLSPHPPSPCPFLLFLLLLLLLLLFLLLLLLLLIRFLPSSVDYFFSHRNTALATTSLHSRRINNITYTDIHTHTLTHTNAHTHANFKIFIITFFSLTHSLTHALTHSLTLKFS